MEWAPTDFEDAISTTNGLRPTFRNFEQENQYGLETLRPKNRTINLGVEDDDESTDFSTLYDAHAELQLKGYCMALKEQFGKKPTREVDEEHDSEIEITNILRKTGQERVPEHYRLNSKTTSRTAIATTKLPIAGAKNLYITDEHFKFATPITYQNITASKTLENTKVKVQQEQPSKIEASISITNKSKVTSDVSKEAMQRRYQDSTKEEPSQMLRQSQRSYEEATVGVPGEQFCTPRQLYFMKARQNR